jgi:hypothetical protein
LVENGRFWSFLGEKWSKMVVFGRKMVKIDQKVVENGIPKSISKWSNLKMSFLDPFRSIFVISDFKNVKKRQKRQKRHFSRKWQK